MKALIGVDGSPGSFAAVSMAARLLSAERDELAFFYAPPTMESDHGDPTIKQRAYTALGDAVFSEASLHLPPEWQSRVRNILGRHSKAQAGLLAAASEGKVDLIVVGARGLGPLKSLFLGSVSRAMVNSASVPVLVTRGAASKDQPAAVRALFAWDGSPGCQRAVEILKSLTFAAGSQGTLLAVVESMLAGALPSWLERKARDADSEAMANAWIREHEAEKNAMRAELAALQASLPGIFQAAPPIVVEGHPSEKILQHAQQSRADLIVVGKRGHDGLASFFLGSTSEHILSQSHCSVLVVPHATEPR